MTRINPDDPKWTAYILGELGDTERAAIELELESSEEARTLVEELRFAADLMKMELRQATAVVPLTTQQRETIHASANVPGPRRWFSTRPVVWAAGLAAAGIVLMVALAPQFLRSPDGARALVLNQIAELRKADEPKSPASKDQTKAAEEFGLRYEHPAPAPATPQAATPRTDEPHPTEANSVQVTQAAPAVEPSKAVPFGEAVQVDADKRLAVRGGGAAGGQSGGLRGGAAEIVKAQEEQQGQQQGQQSQQGQQGQQRQQGQQGAAAGFIGREALDAAPPPPPPAAAPPPPSLPRPASTPPLAPPTAPGVPPAFDRTSPRLYNGAEIYDPINDNPFLPVGQNPLSTFSIDVDTASYSNVRRYINQNQMPPRDAVRIEEMINYFSYDYPKPPGNDPIGATIEAASAPWNPQHRLVRIAIKARDIAAGRRPPSNLVFLLDVSGSMQPVERLPLLKNGIRMLVEQLTGNDRVTVVTYAGTTGVALRPTRGDQKDVILHLIDSLQAGGSTNGGSGIQLAYDQAMANFIPGGVNRVILATDGDFNVGITDRNALLRLIEDKARSGVFLSVLGVGMGNYKDATLETLADKGNGNYAYIDTLNEARKVLVDQMNGTLVTVAKDVKVQVEFNPAVVGAYRLIGYENRALRNEDFNNDLKDAGDMGAGHTVTALYEVVPRGIAIGAPGAPGAPGLDPLKYQEQPAPPPARNASSETLTVKIRYKEPTGAESKLLIFPLVDREQVFTRAGADFRFAAAVASFGMIMRDSPYKGTATIDSVLSMAEDSMGSDRNGYRHEFLQLVQHARQISGR